MTNLIRVGVVDDHPLFREGVVHMLKSVDGIQIVGEGSTITDAVTIAQERIPNVMLLDIGMAGGGIEAAQNVARASPDTQIIMLTASDDEEHVGSALTGGEEVSAASCRVCPVPPLANATRPAGNAFHNPI